MPKAEIVREMYSLTKIDGDLDPPISFKLQSAMERGIL